MLTRVVAVAVLILGVMIAIKDGRILRMTGLTGSCAVVQTYSDSSELTACSAGRLEGRPDLSHRGCAALSETARYQYWRCPAGFDISDLTR